VGFAIASRGHVHKDFQWQNAALRASLGYPRIAHHK
jgi:hypothetical protein